MALSGTINGSVTNKAGYFSFYITWSAVQNVEENYSDVTVNSYWRTINTAYDFDTVGTRPASITIDGVTTEIEKRFNLNPWPSNPYLIQTVTQKVNHNSDGTKSITISASASGYASTYGPSSSPTSPCSASGTITLDTIPRASTFGSISGSNTIGSSMTFNITRASDKFTHQMWYKVGNSDWYDLGSGITTSKSFTIDMATCSQFPNAVNGTMQLCLRTFNGTTQIGSDFYKNMLVNVPTSVVPSIGNVAWTKTSSEPSSWPLTQGVSQGTMKMTGVSGAYGSTITSYSLTFAGLSSTTSSLTVNNISSSGTLSAVAKVTDSRGRTATKTVDFTVSAYSKPVLTHTVYRSDQQGNEDDYGDYMCVIASARATQVGNNSIQSIVLQYKKRNSSVYTSENLESGVIKVVPASSDNTWDWIITIADRVSSVSATDSIGTGEVVLDISANGKGLGIGKVSEGDGVDFGWDIANPEAVLHQMSFRGINLTSPSTDTVDFWRGLGNMAMVYYGASGKVTDQPSNYGFLLNLCSNNSEETWKEIHQIWAQQPGGNLYHRGGSTSGWSGTWKKILDSMNTDRVVEIGSSGFWNYRKWESGIAECWGTRTLTGVKVDKQWGSLYYAETPSAISYPFQFISTPVETAVMSSNNMSAWMASASINTAVSTGKYFIMRPDAAATTSYTVYISYHVYGHWKNPTYYTGG